MKSATTSAASGCVVWILVFSAILTCMLPVFTLVGSVTSFSNFAVLNMGRFLCPEGTTPERYSYASTITDEFGNPRPATAFELHCVDANGDVVKEDPVIYGFLWVGISAALGFLLSGILAFVLAAPAGILIGRALERWKGRKKPLPVQ